VIGGNQRSAGESADGRAIDHRAAALLAHLRQLVLLARPDAALVDGADAVVVLGG